MLDQLKNLILGYQQGMELLLEKSSANTHVAHGELTDQLRYQGQEMTELSKELASFEHNQIRIILDELVTRLILLVYCGDCRGHIYSPDHVVSYFQTAAYY